MTGKPAAATKQAYTLAPDLIWTRQGPVTDHVLSVSDGQIVGLMPLGEFKNKHPDVTVTELPGRAIISGFIDSHTHLGQAFGKAITGGEPAQIWRRIWAPMENSFDAETVYVSAKWMFLEALRGGFTCITNFAVMNREKTEAIHRAAKEVGIRLISCTGSALPVDGVTWPDDFNISKAIEKGLKRAEHLISTCKTEPMITPSVCVPAVQGAPGELMRGLSNFCAENDIVFQIHTNEHHAEVHWSVATHGMRPLEYFEKYDALGPHTLHHHCTLVTEKEIELLRETKSGVSYNPVASAWKGDRVAPALAFAARGVRFGIGTDSTRSDAFRLLESAETVQRISQGMQLADFSSGAAWTWIDAATRGSADVSGLRQVTGELRPGLRADFLVLDRNAPEVIPSWDFEWELVRLYNRDQIESVIVDGRTVMEKQQPVGWDAFAFLKAQETRAYEMVQNAPITRRHGPASDVKRK